MTSVLNHNLHAQALAIVGEIFEDFVDTADDVLWDLTPLLMVEPGPNGPQPASRYLMFVYTKSLVPPGGGGTISAFEIIPSPLQLLNGPEIRDTVQKMVTYIREMRRQQIAMPSPQ